MIIQVLKCPAEPFRLVIFAPDFCENPHQMALIKSVRGFTPEMGRHCYLADNATITGDVIIGNNCSIWFNAVVRGDGQQPRGELAPGIIGAQAGVGANERLLGGVFSLTPVI